ncbi:DUF2147 domain-containing protein [Fusobacterium sp.]|uniref:DUF2147 domain-containing protein n=1 Tax=Fusobacterium sp. TaxID=68766 RepID=UPI0026165DFF|nr:DUF2147 domain-containing protein [Fusobacterium sp.]
MKKIALIFLLASSFAFAGPEKVVGKWITEKADNGNQVIVEIYETSDKKYNGKIVELTMPVYTEGEFVGKEKMDLENPDKNLRNRTLRGIDFVSGFDYSEKEDKFENGKIYNPTNGKTYNSYMKLQDDGKLLVKGSIDKKGLIGKKQIWTRYE